MVRLGLARNKKNARLVLPGINTMPQGVLDLFWDLTQGSRTMDCYRIRVGPVAGLILFGEHDARICAPFHQLSRRYLLDLYESQTLIKLDLPAIKLDMDPNCLP